MFTLEIGLAIGSRFQIAPSRTVQGRLPFDGGGPGTRTPNLAVKSRLLCQIELAPRCIAY